jgi:lipoprotein signal peptidase
MSKLSNKQIYWVGFIVIVIIYSLYNLYLVDVGYYQDIPRKVRHIGKFVAILIIYGTGTFTLRKYTADWMMYIWHLIHIVIIILLLISGIYDWAFGEISVQFRNVANTFFEFLISPLIYIGIGILNTAFNRTGHAPVK